MDFMLNGVDSISSSHRYGIENTRRYAIINMKSLSFCLVEKTFQVKFLSFTQAYRKVFTKRRKSNGTVNTAMATTINPIHFMCHATWTFNWMWPKWRILMWLICAITPSTNGWSILAFMRALFTLHRKSTIIIYHWRRRLTSAWCGVF